MRIFFICQRVPFPPNRGDKIATFNEIRHLAKNHEVHVFCLADGREDLDNVSGLLQYAKDVTAVPSRSSWGKFRALAALFSGEALSVAMLREKKLRATIKEKFAALKPDLIFIFSSNMAQFAADLDSVPRIMQFADLDSLKWHQYATRSKIPLKWIYRRECRLMFDYERRIARMVSHSLVCTDAERSDFERLIPGCAVSTAGNGTDLEFFRSEGRQKKPASIVFTGVMDYFPNVDAVQWFCDAILPIVQQKLPAATFLICGSRPSRSVRRLALRPGVSVTGRVPDVRPFIDACEVCVAPLRMARGIQNKLLEGLAMGLPCVATTAAWRGTMIPEGQGVEAADDPAEFAQRVIHLLGDKNYRDEAARRGRSAVEQLYTWDRQLQTLDRVVGSLVGGQSTVDAPSTVASVQARLRRVGGSTDVALGP